MTGKKILALLGPQALAIGDYYNQMALRGLVAAGRRFNISFDVVIAQTNDRIEEDLRSCCKLEGYDVMMTFGNAMQGPTAACAKEFPRRRFVLIDGFAEGSPNVLSYSSDPLHISFLCGLVAVNLGTSGATGCLLWSDNWVARQWIDSFVLGAKAADTNAKAYYSFAGSADEAHAKASLQMKSGADMIMCHAGASDLGIIRAAKENGKFLIGFLNERDLDPDHVVFDVVRRMEPLVIDAVRRTTSGSFKGGRLIAMGLREGSFDLDLKNLHPKMKGNRKALLERMATEVKRGKYDSQLAVMRNAKGSREVGGIRL